MKFLYFFILFISYSALAQNDSIYVNQRAGGSDGIKIFNSQEITFPINSSDDVMLIKRKDGTTDEIKLSDINKIIFDGITGILDEKFSNILKLENYPNPFQDNTNIIYSLEKQSNIELKIFDMFGNLIQILVNEVQVAGNYHVKWDGTDKTCQKVSSGSYYYQLLADHSVITRQVIIIK